MVDEELIKAKISELNDLYNDLDDKRLKESDENKQCQYYQDMQKINGMTEALRWVLCGLD